MAKYSEIVALLEYFDKKTTTRPSKKSFGRSFKMDKEFDPVEYLTKERAKLERFEKYLKDHEKLSKKEEKKDDKKRQLFGIEWYVVGLISYPLIGYLAPHLPAVLR